VNPASRTCPHIDEPITPVPIQPTLVVPGTITGGDLDLRVETNYPWTGTVRITVQSAPAGQASISARIPSWAAGATFGGTAAEPGSYAKITKSWQSGDQLVLELPMGGWKTSGMGQRHGAPGIRKYTRSQSLLVTRLAPKRDLHMFPYKARTTNMLVKGIKLLYGRGKRD